MPACVDVDYRDPKAVAACLVFDRWDSPQAAQEFVAKVDSAAPYESGAFCKCELPCLLAVLGQVTQRLEAVTVDSYVDLASGQPGLGQHLFRAINIPVIGVAKTQFRGAVHAVPILRGQSARPVFVTAAGMDAAEAARNVSNMAGGNRIPTLLRRVDRLCRETPL